MEDCNKTDEDQPESRNDLTVVALDSVSVICRASYHQCRECKLNHRYNYAYRDWKQVLHMIILYRNYVLGGKSL